MGVGKLRPLRGKHIDLLQLNTFILSLKLKSFIKWGKIMVFELMGCHLFFAKSNCCSGLFIRVWCFSIDVLFPK